VFAKVDGQHFTAFIVERGMGVQSGAEEHKLGLDGNSTTALMFDDVQVPVENVLGTVGEGHKVAFNILNLGRVKLGTRNIGGAKQALTGAVRYAIGRKQFGKPIASFGLIKHKIAEMSIRCFVGDAMVFRSLGEVDEALGAVDQNDPAVALKTIEQFAIECSINKVWSSEALAYVVDEALQVYGGNGYSREFPAERAYRDARITRIYEGTNEINRIIVGTRIARSAAVAAAIADAAGAAPASDGSLLARAKRLTLWTFGQAAQKYGKGLSNEQEVVSRLADMAIEVYALESAVLRADKLQARGSSLAAVAADMVQVFSADSVDRLTHAAKNALAAIAAPDPTAALQTVQTLLQHRAVDTIAARRRIADAIIDANRYPL
jgi:alkylation response protein AidB-like acyl-CoA dehydrogenase